MMVRTCADQNDCVGDGRMHWRGDDVGWEDAGIVCCDLGSGSGVLIHYHVVKGFGLCLV